MVEQNLFLVLIFGLLYTIQMHIAEGMQKHGIGLFSKDTMKEKKRKKSKIWTIGFILMMTVDIHQIIGLAFGTSTQFTAVFGLGLIALALYSSKLGDESLKARKNLGMAAIIIGTCINGIYLVSADPTTLMEASMLNLYITVAITISLALILTFLSLKQYLMPAVGFGFACGIFSTYTLLFKRVGYTNNLWFIGFSFLMGLSSVVLMNLGFSKGAEATKLVPVYNSIYIIFPIIIEPILYNDPASKIHYIQIIAIIIIVIGIFFITEKKLIIDGQKEENNSSL